MSGDRIQPGIYFRRGERPPLCWRMLLLDVERGTPPKDARDAIALVLRMFAGLRAGRVRELEGQPRAGAAATRATFANQSVLVGYGRSLWDHDPALTRRSRPDYLAYLSKLPAIARTRVSGRAEADVAFQITGSDVAAAARAAVEVWKLIEDEALPLRPVASFDGFGRADGRGWLEFHDGVGNLGPSERLAALAARGDPRWMAGGTYMAYMRFQVDLATWRSLDCAEQELVIGRDKLTGNPLVGVTRDRQGRARPVAGPPPPVRMTPTQRAAYADPAETTDPVLESSHTHRANQNRASPDAPAALRIYRQGYEFLESLGPDGPRLGLNFVSFQSDLGTIQHLLHLPGWFGDVNFGGPSDPGPGDPPSPKLLSLAAGGLYAVPPRARPFPGAILFG